MPIAILIEAVIAGATSSSVTVAISASVAVISVTAITLATSRILDILKK